MEFKGGRITCWLAYGGWPEDVGCGGGGTNCGMVLLLLLLREIFESILNISVSGAPEGLKKLGLWGVSGEFIDGLFEPFGLVLDELTEEEEDDFFVYPLFGPRLSGTLVNMHESLFLSQLVHILTIELEFISNTALHRTFFLLHSSHALETFDRFRGGSLPCGLLPVCTKLLSSWPF